MKRPTIRRVFAATLITIGGILVTIGGGASAKAGVKVDQCANLGTTCDSAHDSQWINGAVNENKSSYAEGDSLPYRAVMTDLTVDATYSLQIVFDTTKGGRHALDFLTTYDRTESTADPCAGLTCGSPTSTLAIGSDSNIPGGIQIGGQSFTAFGATFPASGSTVANSGDLCGAASCAIASNPEPYVLSGTYSGNSSTSVRIYFTAKSSTVVLAWAGHIASRVDWGADASAATINGSPYHTQMGDFDCSDENNCNVGNEDLALASAAVLLPGTITIIKQVPGTSSTSFPYIAGSSPLGNFSLTDDGTSANTRTFSGITDFVSYTITESAVANWDLDTAVCQVTSPNGGTFNVSRATVTIDLREGEHVTCVYSNTPTPIPGLSIKKTADPTIYAAEGDKVTFTYVLTNSGQTVLGPTQFTVDDDHINGGAPFDCGPPNTTLAIGGTVSCTATYTVTFGDVEGGSVINTAFGAGGGVSTSTVQATIVYSATTTSDSSTTSTSEDSPTTSTDSPTTTVSPTSTIGITGTTIADEFFIIFPEEFPSTGDNDGLLAGVGVMAMLVGLLVMISTFDPPSNKRRRLKIVKPSTRD